MTEDRGQMTEDRGQMTEGRGQKTEDRGQMTEGRGQKTEDRDQMTEDRCQGAGIKFVSAIICLICGLLLFPNLSFPEEAKETCGAKCHLNPQAAKDKNLQQCGDCHNASIHNSSPPEMKISANPPNSHDLKNMIFIPEGEFIMGTDDRMRDEKPAHTVYVNGFYMDMYEVTNADYKRFIDHTGYPPPDKWEEGNFEENKGKHPVAFVSWYDADNYCRWAGKRLPGEIEWEKAARGTDGRVFPWGNEWDEIKSNNPMRELDHTQPVGTYENGKSPYGLYDMSGNVWEWVDDYYYAHPGSDYVNPEFGNKYRMLKGGSFWDCTAYGCGISAPTYNRAFFEPTVKGKTYGFRCAKGQKTEHSKQRAE